MTKQQSREWLWQLVGQEKNQLLTLCSQLIQIDSVEDAGLEVVCDYVCNFLTELGVSHQVLRPVDNTPCIVASLGSGEKPVALFNGHNDVVETGDLSKWNFDPFCGAITDTHILGRGTSDMKCGVGVFLFIVKLICDYKLPFDGTIKLHIVHDEEKGGEKGSLWLTQNGYADDVDFCIVPEPTSYDNIEIGQKGSVRLTLKTFGEPVNGSVINYVGESAVHNMVAILSRINDLSALTGPMTEEEKQVVADSKMVIRGAMGHTEVGEAIDHVNVNIIDVVGGTGSTMTAETCEARIGLLVPFCVSRSEVEAALDAIIAEVGVRCEVTCQRWKEGARTPRESALVQSVQSNAQQVWQKPITPAYQWATSDAKYYRYLGIPTIQYGPANNKGIHSYNEDVDIEDVVNCAKTHLGVLVDLINLEGKGDVL